MPIDEKRYFENLDKLNEEVFDLRKRISSLTKETRELKTQFMKIENRVSGMQIKINDLN